MPKKDLGIVISTGHRKWAIGELAKTLNSSFSRSSIIEIPQSRREARSIYGYIRWPKKSFYLFMHHALALQSWDKGWIKEGSHYGIRYTHESIEIENSLNVFLNACFITVENSQSRFDLIRKGLSAEKVFVLPHPIEVDKFSTLDLPKTRDVIFVSSFYQRKNPDLILEVISRNPSLTFTILGKGWNKWEKFPHLVSLDNFKYMSFSYTDYPQVLGSHRIFCSLSLIEGGPVPLIESLAAGLKVVTTDTGHVRDVLSHPRRYNILSHGANSQEVSISLKEALCDVSQDRIDVTRFDFQNYLRKIRSLSQDCAITV